jgi:glutamate 5-kinase
MMHKTRRIVVKLGTSVLTNNTLHLNRQKMLEIVQQIASLHQAGHEIVVVSSGAQAAGRERLDFPDLEKLVPARQMLAAVGQSRLMHIYSELFDIFEIIVGQVLLTRGDLDNRLRYLNARDTLITLIERRIIPIINENDTTATDEIRVGDNDNLSALVANLMEADLLIMLTDQPGLFTEDPRHNHEASLIAQLERVDEEAMALAGGVGTSLGTGGMRTKLQAARLASLSGVTSIIAEGREPDVLRRILDGEALGTRIEAATNGLESRKRWLVTEKSRGKLHVDAGAARKLQTGGASLLPVGVTRVEGKFERGAHVMIIGPDDKEIAQGLSSYSSKAIQQLCGLHSGRISEILGYSYGDAVVHRNNMVLLT